MSEQRELRPCPFCGGAVSRCDESPLYGGSIMHDETECLFKDNLLFHKDIAERWNSRPLEDALRTRIAELEKAAVVWHSYPEEKPEPDTRHLVVVNGNVHISRYDAEQDIDKINVTHWAYLPALPEEVSND